MQVNFIFIDDLSEMQQDLVCVFISIIKEMAVCRDVPETEGHRVFVSL